MLPLDQKASESGPVDARTVVRIARPSTDLAAAARFYVDGLGLRVLWQAQAAGPDEHDLLMVGPEDATWHMELTRHPTRPTPPTPTDDDLLVVYLGRVVDTELVERLIGCGGTRVPAHNPYWDVNGVTLADPDGYRVVLTSRNWGAPAEPDRAVLVRSAEAETLADGPAGLTTLLADAPDTGGALTANRATLKTGSRGAPVHFHTRASEVLYVLDGTLRALAGDTVHTLHRGDFLLLPPRLPHAFAPGRGQEAEVLVLFTPGLPRFDYYRLLERVASGAASVEEIRESSERYDNHYVHSAPWEAERREG